MSSAVWIVRLVPFLLVISLVLAGCAGKPVRTSYYSLTPLAGEALQPPGGKLSLEIGPVSLPPALNREQIITRTGTNRFVINSYHRWAGALDQDLTSVLIQNLGALLGTGRVAGFGQIPLGPADYRVILDIQQFDGIPEDSATLKATWTILSPKQKKILSVRQTNLKESLPGPGFEGLVHGQSHLVEKLSREIARELMNLNRGS